MAPEQHRGWRTYNRAQWFVLPVLIVVGIGLWALENPGGVQLCALVFGVWSLSMVLYTRHTMKNPECGP